MADCGIVVGEWVVYRKEEEAKMNFKNPVSIPKADYKAIVDLISVPNSPVGIDAQYTHAIVITYLQQISARLERLEEALMQQGK